MNDARKTKARLIEEIEELRRRLGEAGGSGADRLRTVLDHAPQIVLEIDAEGRVLYANRLLSGRPVATALGQEAAGFLPDEARDRFREVYAEALREKKAIIFPVRDLVLQGKHYSIVVHVRPIVHESEPTTASVIVDDVTERTRLAREVESHVELEGLLLRISGEFTAVLDPSGFDDLVPGILRRVGEALGAEQASLFFFDDSKSRIRRAHDWRRSDRPPLPTDRGEVRADALPWITGRLLAGETVLLRGLRDIPPEEEKERRWFAEHGIAHVLDVPLHVEGLVQGFLGFKWTEATDSLSPITRFALGALGQILGDTLTRVRDREAAERSRAGYRNLIEQSLVGIGVLQGSPPRFVFANRAAAAFVNCSVDELLRKTPEEVALLIDPSGRSEVFSRYEARIAGENVPARFEVPLAPIEGGTPRVLEMYARPIEYLGAPAVQLVAVDITTTHEAEKARRSSEERYRLLTESAKELIFTIDRSMRMTYVNPAFAAYGGRSREEIEGRTIAELLPPEIARVREADVRGAFAMGGFNTIDVSFPWRGRMIHLDISSVPFAVAGGEADEVLFVARDVTAEQESENALRESEEKYRALAESARDFIFVVNRDLSVSYVNEAGAQSLGSHPDEISGRPVRSLFPGATADLFEKNIRAVFETGESYRAERAVQFLGARVWLDTTLVPLRGEGGAVFGVMGHSRDITALKEAEERYRTLAESSRDFIFVVRADTTIEYANTHAAALLGNAIPEIVGRRLRDIFPKSYAEAFAHEISEVFETGQPLEVERLLELGEHPIWALTMLTPIKNQDGSVATVMTVSRDITKRRQIELEHRRSEERLQAIFEGASYGFVLAERESFRLVMTNPAVREMLGYDEGELAPMTAHDLHPPGVFEDLSREDAALADQRARVHHEIPMRRKDGSVFYADFSVVDIEFSGRPHTLGIVQDATDRREAERALRESRHLLGKTFEALADSTLIIGRQDETIFDCNPATSEMFGFARDELIGRHPKVLLPKESDIDAFRPFLFQAIEKEGGLRHHEMIMKRKDGSLFSVAHTVTPLIGDDGECFGWLAVTRDITERHEAERQKQKYTEELEEGVRERTKQIERLEARRAQDQKLVAIANMAARIAHEIKNPLAGMRNAFQLVKEGVSPGFEHHAYVGMIEREIRRIGEIVDQMSRLYRPSSEQPSLVDLEACLADVIAILGLEAKERSVGIRAAPVAGEKTAIVPEGLLREILYNLVRNAVEASPPGAEVRVGLDLDGGFVGITVMDRGKGIPEAIRTRVFEAFFSTKSEVMSGGRGLGLAIVRSNVGALGGTIDFETKEGMGTTFRVRLPVGA